MIGGLLAWPIWPHVYLLLVVMIGWVFFRAETLPGAIAFLKAMAGLRGGADAYTLGWYLTPELWLALAGRRDRIGAAGCRRSRRGRDSSGRGAGRPLLDTAALAALLVAVDHAGRRAHLQPVHLFPILMPSTQA